MTNKLIADPASIALRAVAPGAKTIIVAIDGPAGSGKSSVAKAVAAELGYGMLDTGAAYRTLAYAMLKAGKDLDDPVAAVAAQQSLDLQLPLAPDLPIMMGTEDVTAAIRTAEISPNVSRVSKHQGVRDAFNAYFRNLVEESGLAGVVIEGRDITTVVAPYAQVRVILTASQEVRAQRRQKQLPELSFAEVLADLKARDEKDLKVVNFIDPAPGVTLIDTTELDFAGSVQALIAEVHRVESVD